ncbi:MAG TPA: cupin domain-containing protein [Rhizomicrobium sp.]|nr:cupin domain-containing protein [Rhizomicrobium sp.]
MHTAIKYALTGVIAAGLGAAGFAAIAQTDPKVGVTVNDPVGPVPDPARVGFTLSKDLKCTGTEGKMQMCYLYGDPKKPGPYTVMYKWWPGNFSKPHYHNNERWAYIVSGTWWTASTTVYDERTTYPVPAGSVAVDKLKGIHWDGARKGEKEPTVLILSGTGPHTSQLVDENGKDLGPPF